MSIEDKLQNLAKSINQQKTVLFIGSGFSLNAEPINPKGKSNFSDWAKLTQKMIDELEKGKKKQKAKYSELPYPEIIQLYETAYLKDKCKKIIRESIPTDKFKPGELHKILLDTTRFPWHAIVTTNIDDLIEKTLNELDIPYTCIFKSEHFYNIHGLPVYKIHGTYEDETSWVFTEKEYLDYEDNHPFFVTKMRQLFFEYNCLFVGYSLKDPDFKQIFQWVDRKLKDKRDYRPETYTLFQEILPAQKKYWKETKLTIFEYPELKETFSQAIKIVPDKFDTNNHQNVLSNFLEVLYQYVKKEPLSLFDTLSKPTDIKTSYLLEHKIIQMIEANYPTIIGTLAKLRSNLFQETSSIHRKTIISKLPSKLENMLVSYWQNLYKLLSGISSANIDRNYNLEIYEIIFGIDSASGHDEDILKYFYLTSFIKYSNKIKKLDTFNKVTFIFECFIEYIELRQSEKFTISMELTTYRSWIKKIRFLKISPENKYLCDNVSYLILFAVYLLNNLESEPSALVKCIVSFLKNQELKEKYKTALYHRLNLFHLILGKYVEIYKFLKSAPQITKSEYYSPLWNCLLEFYLNYEKSREGYENIEKNTKSEFLTRYLALQALKSMQVKSKEDYYESYLANVKDTANQLEKIEIWKGKAKERDIRIDHLNLLDHTNFRYKILKRAFDIELNDKTWHRYPDSSITVRLNYNINVFWNAGIPFQVFSGEDFLLIFNSMLKQSFVGDILKYNFILPLITDWSKTNVKQNIKNYGITNIGHL
jgi:hypothetical protein